jgi:hypothetical protein
LATITVYGGDFKAGQGTYSSKQFNLKSDTGPGVFFGESIPLDRLAKLETVSLENNGRDTGSTVGRALVGELLVGPIGAIIAAGTAKNRNQVTFLATFDDNRQFLGATDSETFKTWMGTLLTRRRMEENEIARAAARPVPQNGPTIRQQVSVPQLTTKRRLQLTIMTAALFIFIVAIFSGENRTPRQQQASAVPPKPSAARTLDIDAQCNLSGAIPNCKEELPKLLAKEAALKLSQTTSSESASTPAERPPSSKELKAREEAAFRQCWANANAAAARGGFKLSPEVVANPGLVNADIRNMYLTANQIIEEKTCEASARMDNGGYSTLFHSRTYKGSDGHLHFLD